jgi:hypothetical protein
MCWCCSFMQVARASTAGYVYHELGLSASAVTQSSQPLDLAGAAARACLWHVFACGAPEAMLAGGAGQLATWLSNECDTVSL